MKISKMENVERVIDLVNKRRTVRAQHFKDMERKQLAEYNDIMKTLQTTKDDTNDSIEKITNNLQHLITHKDSIYTLIHNSESTSGLPVSHDHHRQTIMLLSEGIDFINKFPNILDSFDNEKEENKNSEILINDITSCTNSVESEIYKIKSLISETQTLQQNVDLLNELKKEFSTSVSE